MRKFKIMSVLLSLVLIFSGLAACGGNDLRNIDLVERNKLRGEQIFKSTVDKYFLRDDLIVNQYYSKTEEIDAVADIWHFSSLQEAALYYLELNPTSEYAKGVETDLQAALQYYIEGRTDNNVVYGMYRGAEPNKNKFGENLYDDMSCIIRNQIHSYNITKNEATLVELKNAMKYITDNGWDKSYNPATGKEWGGNDQGPASANYYKPICANEIVANDLLVLGDITTGEEKANYLDWAKKYYDFCVETFRLENNLYGDYVGVERVAGQTVGYGVVALDMYTYHQGAMIEAGVRMYKATNNPIYLTQAKETAKASREFFGRRDIIEGMYQLPYNIYHWFNLLLVRGYIMIAEIDSSYNIYVDEIQASIDYAYDNFYDDGMLPTNFLQGWIKGNPFDENINVMDSAAYAQYYFMLASYQQNKAK